MSNTKITLAPITSPGLDRLRDAIKKIKSEEVGETLLASREGVKLVAEAGRSLMTQIHSDMTTLMAEYPNTFAEVSYTPTAVSFRGPQRSLLAVGLNNEIENDASRATLHVLIEFGTLENRVTWNPIIDGEQSVKWVNADRQQDFDKLTSEDLASHIIESYAAIF